jgi:glycine hydroxymethyltransferase
MQRDEQPFDLILEEQERQTTGLELIRSENFVSDEAWKLLVLP